jgi:Family of unknown function (DUF6152)
MKTRFISSLFVALAALLFSVQLFAHHGTASYEVSKVVTVKATVTDFQFINPHSLVFFEAKDDQGESKKWQGELTSPNRLTRVGWNKNSLKPGDVVTLSGYPAKSGVNSIWITKVVLADGSELSPGV